MTKLMAARGAWVAAGRGEGSRMFAAVGVVVPGGAAVVASPPRRGETANGDRLVIHTRKQMKSNKASRRPQVNDCAAIGKPGVARGVRGEVYW